MKNAPIILFLAILFAIPISCNEKASSYDEVAKRPETKGKRERSGHPEKNALWTPEEAANHQRKLLKTAQFARPFNHNKAQAITSYANGALTGEWVNRAPKNMPGAFKFAEMLDGTDIIYGVTWNHYVGEYNSSSYIHKGTVYNPTTGTGGDDFQIITPNWPNRYQNLFAFQITGQVRLVAQIESGPVYYSDDEGATWVLATGLPAATTSAVINRQDSNRIYVTEGTTVYVSTDFGASFSTLQTFPSSQSSFLYTPRYAVQGNAQEVYLARSGSFYKLNAAKTNFDLRGTYTSSHTNSAFSIGGDDSKLYVTENKKYYVSTDEGNNWTTKTPNGNWYGDTSGPMDAGFFMAVHPTNTEISLGGYAIPVISTDGLDNVQTDHTGWGNYQNGTNLSVADYHNRIRFNYHPDFQSSHFFYNSSGNILSVRCSDGGMYVSYKEWTDFPAPGAGYNNTDYANAHFININLLSTITPLVYRKTIFTGSNNPDHINFATQDQGSQSIIPGTSGDVLDFYQSIGGDGQTIDSYDGVSAWKWDYNGSKVWSPVSVYGNGGAFQSIGAIHGQFSSSQTVDFTGATEMYWAQTYIDRHNPDQALWVLRKNLHRAKWNGTTLTGLTITKGINQVAALAQGSVNANKLYMLQDGDVYISNDRGNTFGTAINTPFNKTNGGWTKGDIGSGVVLPGNDNWVIFCGPTLGNNVGSILSKDGGTTWIDVTGDYPTGDDTQTGGMEVTPDGKFVFAGTDIGAFVFNVAEEKWYSLSEGAGFFNTTDVQYIASTKTMRFASWGSGILDFKIEELNPVCLSESTIVQNTISIHSVSSQQTTSGNESAASVLDNDSSTFWHTKYSAPAAVYPHEIVLDLGSAKVIKAFRYLPRQSGSNGRIANYEIYITNNTGNYGTAVATGTWPNSSAEELVTFTPKEGRYVRLRALSEVNGNNWASAAELNIVECEAGCISGSTTYTTAGGWSNGAPNSSTEAIFKDSYNTSTGNITACGLIVENGAVVTVGAGEYLSVERNIKVETGGSIIVSHQGSVVQVADDAVVINNGTINVKLTTPALNARDFMIMGSPMTAANNTMFSAYQVLNHTTANFTPYVGTPAVVGVNFHDQESNDWSNFVGQLTPGEGYLVRPSYTAGGTYNYEYNQGTLNNGIITYSAFFGDDKEDSPNVISNPYASAIDATMLIANNAMIDEVYFWEHLTTPVSGIPGPLNENFNMEDISTYNGTMGIPASNDPGTSTTPNGVISTGQGFGIKANAGGNVTFNNAMRLTTGNTTLRRSVPKDLLWLTVREGEYHMGSTAGIGFLQSASENLDPGFDTQKLGTVVSLYSHLPDGSEQLGIQGREIFDDAITIPMGFSTLVDEDGGLPYVISISDMEGSLIEEATVYLIDHLENTVTNLSEGNYEFVAEAGTYDNRFTLQFESLILDVNASELDAVSIFPNPTQNTINIVSPNAALTGIEIFDLRGRSVKRVTITSETTQRIDISNLESALYFVKISSENGLITKRIIKQ
ncbi:discoidin domain-containing protein [Ulvibacter antarcticus]|uniref:Putative secreted protein (Por secretion system target) n=1 Tax=Ulvibacter antarcticus TaxID=442714 RepID=A0A3L9YAJ5_9FLAO|nr:discoidin domain-containing protein [Ulvibacter antarcticus]RMA57756.1 putative secreted protein (Por secretion system target) [Ulvibacter antarcticus]